MPTQLFVGPYAPSGKKTMVAMAGKYRRCADLLLHTGTRCADLEADRTGRCCKAAIVRHERVSSSPKLRAVARWIASRVRRKIGRSAPAARRIGSVTATSVTASSTRSVSSASSWSSAAASTTRRVSIAPTALMIRSAPVASAATSAPLSGSGSTSAHPRGGGRAPRLPSLQGAYGDGREHGASRASA